MSRQGVALSSEMRAARLPYLTNVWKPVPQLDVKAASITARGSKTLYFGIADLIVALSSSMCLTGSNHSDSPTEQVVLRVDACSGLRAALEMQGEEAELWRWSARVRLVRLEALICVLEVGRSGAVWKVVAHFLGGSLL